MTDLGDAAKKVQRLGDNIEDGVSSHLDSAMERVEDTSQQNLLAGSTRQRDSGALYNSITSDVVGADSGIDLSTDTYTAHHVSANAPYAKYIEYGTGVEQAGTPESGMKFQSPSTRPVPAIKEWIESKPVIPKNPRYRNADGTVDSLGLALDIAERIWRYGNQSHPFMRPAIEAHRLDLSLAHFRGIRQGIRRTF